MTIIFYFIDAVIGGPDYESLKKETLEYEALQIPKTVPTPCDKEIWLYTFGNENRTSKMNTRKNWYYYAHRIKGSNLLLLIVNGMMYGNVTGNGHTHREISYNVSLPCYIATKNNYTRRSYISCYNRNKKVNFFL